MDLVVNKETEKDKILQLVSFKIDEEEFGVNIYDVQEIMQIIPITRIPNLPESVEGIINLRGKVIRVIDLRKRLGLPSQKPSKDTMIIIVEIANKTTGFIVDEVNEVLRVSTSIMESPPDIVGGINAGFIEAIGKLDERLLILLNLTSILSTEEIEIEAL